jgi:hypothetical protein
MFNVFIVQEMNWQLLIHDTGTATFHFQPWLRAQQKLLASRQEEAMEPACAASSVNIDTSEAGMYLS